MKYIFVVRHLGSGGAETATIILGKTLAARGHQIEIWNTGKNNIADLPKWNSWSKVQHISRYTLLFYNQKPTETLVLVDNVGSRYAPTKGVISIIHGNCIKDFKQQQSFWGKCRALRKLQGRYGKRQNVVVSSQLAHELALFTKVEPLHIPNPFDQTTIIENASKEFAGDLPTNFIVHIGRLSAEKRQDILLNSYLSHAVLPIKADLVFVGGEHKPHKPLQPILEESVRQTPFTEKVHFLGDQINPWSILKKARCLVLCSEYETMGYVLLEAMALGIPIVSTDVAGPREVLGEEFPGLVKQGENLGERIAEALDNPELFILPVPIRYQPESIAEQFEELVSQLSNP